MWWDLAGFGMSVVGPPKPNSWMWWVSSAGGYGFMSFIGFNSNFRWDGVVIQGHDLKTPLGAQL